MDDINGKNYLKNSFCHLKRFKDIYKKSLNNFNIAANIFII
jgi:hypothetical protein